MAAFLYHPLQIGSVRLEGNLFLAPVAGYTDRAFRSICVEAGANLTCTELVSAEGLIRDSKKTAQMLLRAPNERYYVVQLFGADPATMAQAVALLSPYHPDVVDINCGCPVPKVVKSGAGAALLREPDRLAKVVESVVQAAQKYLGGVPVTIKIRSGWDETSINYPVVAHRALEAGVAAIALHARTRSQGYAGKANWQHIAHLVSLVNIPVIGSGDLFTPEDGKRMLEQTGCGALMFARGAMGNPFIFTETRELLEKGKYAHVPVERRLQWALRQLELRALDVGEEVACREMRKQFCAYARGISGASHLRNAFVQAKTIEDYRKIVHQTFPHIHF
ncbi:MAG: tRNA dihydrouridine synthase DusB [Treponemataceae bacterium]|nr:tRNA dihydrouridine synthase DusB [Treponemataceae bacterium]